MKRSAQIIALLGFVCGMGAAGCVNIPDAIPGENSFLYPDTQFESQKMFTAWAGMERIGVTNHCDYVRVFSEWFSTKAYGDLFTSAERESLQSDPFLKTPGIPFVTFQTFDPAQRVAKYYEAQFRNSGWQKVRGILLCEECGGGGDWIRVYRKGDALVHIHIMGPWKRDRNEFQGMAEGGHIARLIMFKFLGIAPEDFLGSDYRNKTWRDPTSPPM